VPTTAAAAATAIAAAVVAARTVATAPQLYRDRQRVIARLFLRQYCICTRCTNAIAKFIRMP